MNKLKLSFSDRENYEWIINGKAIICKMCCTLNLPFEIIANYRNKMRKLFPELIWCYGGGITFTSVGIAKCNDSDEMDENLGRHIAEARAKQKAYSVTNRYMNTLVALMEEDIDVMTDFINSSCDHYYHESKHINWLTTGEE